MSGTLSKWLLHDDRKELVEILVAGALNVLFLALIALLLWPLDKLPLALRMAQGYGVLWIVAGVTIVLLYGTHRLFRVDLYTRANAYVLSNVAASCLLQAGWAAFAAGAVRSFAAGASLWIAISLYLVGLVSCLIAFFAVSSFYQGHIYKLVSLPVTAASFIVFSVWPASGSMMYGWFFDLF
jgi:hypothetical protein